MAIPLWFLSTGECLLLWVLLNNPKLPWIPLSAISISQRQVIYEALNRLYNICYDYSNRGERGHYHNINNNNNINNKSYE